MNRYNGMGSTYDDVRAVAVDSAGDVIVTGSSGYHYYTAKYAAADGALLWEKRYNGPGDTEDDATGVAVDGGGERDRHWHVL